MRARTPARVMDAIQLIDGRLRKSGAREPLLAEGAGHAGTEPATARIDLGRGHYGLQIGERRIRRQPPGIEPPSFRPLGMVPGGAGRSEEHTSELQSRLPLVCRLLL